MTELVAGLSLGLGAGVAPGPLLTLVVTSTLERGFGAGLRVAIAPLMTDAPIVALTVALVSTVDPAALRALGIVGGITVALMGVWSIVRARSAVDGHATAGMGDLWRGIAVNFLSPHPWIFWIGAGAPLLVAAWRDDPNLGMAFLAGFYALLIGSKVVIAAVVAAARSRLTPTWRVRLVVVGGALLVVGGSVLVWEAAAGRL